MDSVLIPDEVASLARKHTGVIAQHSAIWDGIVCDLIVKGPTGDHEVVVEPAVDTIFLTRSNDPHRIVKRLNKGPERSVVHPGAIVNFVAAGDTLVTQVRRGNSGMDRTALSILPRALQCFDEFGRASHAAAFRNDARAGAAAGNPQDIGGGSHRTRPPRPTLRGDIGSRADRRPGPSPRRAKPHHPRQRRPGAMAASPDRGHDPRSSRRRHFAVRTRGRHRPVEISFRTSLSQQHGTSTT